MKKAAALLPGPDAADAADDSLEDCSLTSSPSEDAGSLADLLGAVARTPAPALKRRHEPPPQPDLLGSGFSIVRKLGIGSFGVVYEALDHERQQTVALKVLYRLDPARLYAFKREFRALTNLRHRNLVQLYELHAFHEQWFFSMELVEGYSLKEFFARKRRAVADGEPLGPVSTTEAMESTLDSEGYAGSAAEDAFLRTLDAAAAPAEPVTPRPALSNAYLAQVQQIFTQLCRGVEALHSEGMLHRDLKPSNVHLTHDGQVKLLDFGLIMEQRGQTHDGSIAGTPLYMSPEQALASEELTPASDWYSVGVMLYQALAGRAPFDSITSLLALLQAKQMRDPDPPSSLVDGVPPGLERLCLGLLRRAPADRPPAEAILEALGDGDGASPAGSPAIEGTASWQRADRVSAFVGREGELGTLQRALDEVQTTDGPVVCLVSGVSGVGKSTLLDHFIAGLESENALVLHGASYAQESVPYKAWDLVVDLLSQFLGRLPLEAQLALAPRSAGALKRVFPVLGRVKAIKEAPELPVGIDAGVVRRRAFGALQELIGRLAELHQLIIHLEDLHWSDIDSMELLLHLLGGAAPPRILLLGSFRSDELESSPALQYLFERLAQTPAFHPRLLTLDPLSSEEAGALASHLLGEVGSPERLEEIVRESGGNPIFVAELSRAAAVYDDLHGAMDFDQIVLRRAAALPEDARRLLEAVAVAGEPLPPDQAAAALGLKIGHDSVRALLAEHLLRVRSTTVGQQVEIYHARIRDSLIRGLSTPAQMLLHGQLARTLERDATVDPERLAGHFFGAGDARRGWSLIRRAAAEAREVLAFERAIRLCRKLLAESNPDEEETRRLHCSLASALANTGRYDDAVRHFDAGLEGDQVPAPRGKLETGLAVLRSLLALFNRLYLQVGRRRPGIRESELLDLRYEKTLSLVYVDPLRMFLESLALQQDLARYPVRATPRGLEIWSLVASVIAFSGLSFGLARRILARCDEVLDPTKDSEVLSFRVGELVIKFSAGEWAAIPPLDGQLLRRNLKDGRFWHVSTYVLYHGLLHLGRGELDKAERLIERLHRIAERYKYRVAGAYAYFLRVNLLVRGRHLRDAGPTIEAGLEYHRQIGMEGPQILFHAAMVLARLTRGELEAARAAMTCADELVARQAPAPPHYVAVYWVARVRLAQRQLEDAVEAGDVGAARRWRRAAANDLRAAARTCRSYAYGRAEVLTLQGRQCWIEGHRQLALRRWKEAVTEAERLGSRLDEARARVELGRSLAEEGGARGTDLAPEAQLERARRLFEDLGARGDLARLREWREATRSSPA